MTRESFLFKWFWYAVAVIPVWLTEDLVFSRFSIFGVSPILLPLVIVAVAVLEGPAAGSGFGLAVGLWWAAALPGTHPWILVIAVLVGLLSGLISQYRLKQSYVGCLLCSLAVLGIFDLLRCLWYLFRGKASAAALLRIAIPEVLVSLIFVAPIYLLFRLVYARVGGTKLA